MEPPETRYARSDGLNIAYQDFGSGPPVLFVPPVVSNMELAWEHELYRRGLEHYAGRVRLLMFDKRGIGLSDRFEAHPTLEQRLGDIDAVLDAVGVERCAIVGLSEGGLMAQQYAAVHPERVERLVLINTFTGFPMPDDLGAYVRDGDPPTYGFPEIAARFEEMIEAWGVDPEPMVRWTMPSQLDNPSFVRWVGRLQRLTATRADFRRQIESVGGLEPVDPAAIAVPALVVHVRDDRTLPVVCGRWIADRMPNAEYLELPTEDHFVWVSSGWRELIDRCIDFMVGEATGAPAREERRFATVLFTDIVGSTDTARDLGDRSWEQLLDAHDRTTWQVVDRFGGRIVKTTGDGALVLFDTPSSAVACARELTTDLAGIGVPIRAGLHAGEVVVRADGDVAGMAVHLAARVQGAAQPSQVLVSSTVRDLLLGSAFAFTDAGEHTLKGVDGRWRLYSAG